MEGGLTLPSICSSHWSPRLVTILGVLSSTGRMSTRNCWGAAVIIWGGGKREPKKTPHHSQTSELSGLEPWNQLTLQSGRWAGFHHLAPLGLGLRENTACWRALWEGKGETRGTGPGWDLACYGSWHLHPSACSEFNVTLRWNHKQNIFLSITLVKFFLRGRRKPSLKC